MVAGTTSISGGYELFHVTAALDRVEVKIYEAAVQVQ